MAARPRTSCSEAGSSTASSV
jgi:AraC-like DNA-binding protein